MTKKSEEPIKIVLEDSMLKAVKISVKLSKKAITISNGVHCTNYKPATVQTNEVL